MTPIFLGKAGSHSYGTATENSDNDFRGIFVAEEKYIRTPFFHQYEYRDPNEKDSVSYELNKFMQLYTDCNPNIIELLWIEESDIIIDTPSYRYLRSYREQLLSSKVAFTFSGYGISQLKQAKNQSNWANSPQPENPPKQTDYVSLVVNYTDSKVFKINIEDYHDDYRLVHYGNQIYGVYQESGYTTYSKKNFHLNTNSESFDHTTLEGIRKIPLFVVKFNIEQYKADLEKHRNYWNWKSLKDKKIALFDVIEQELKTRSTDVSAKDMDIDSVVNTEDVAKTVSQLSTSNLRDLLHLCQRHLDFRDSSDKVDWKHLSHLVRLFRMAEEILTTGKVIVKRPDSQYLRDIRAGKYSYSEILEWGEKMDKKVREELYPNTKLRKKPNLDLATEVLINIQNHIWFNHKLGEK
jgi:hypothetical protein